MQLYQITYLGPDPRPDTRTVEASEVQAVIAQASACGMQVFVRPYTRPHTPKEATP
ncbi:hypothetical protein [Streptomyces erythrochromogenes]|uniref:hypothetical protein n=1 Tax=Streptomyces erythrochromogenes TaxID=285574 RepID=UPI00386D793D|nr:hypothetical protein OG364_00520 [Streptomyces erythrochromogenes]WST98438.1 hypothetical protein OG364_41015 [Streptomyces erythrochromogenes]